MKTKIGHEDEIPVKTKFGLGHAEDEIRNSALKTKFGPEDEIRPRRRNSVLKTIFGREDDAYCKM